MSCFTGLKAATFFGRSAITGVGAERERREGERGSEDANKKWCHIIIFKEQFPKIERVLLVD